MFLAAVVVFCYCCCFRLLLLFLAAVVILAAVSVVVAVVMTVTTPWYSEMFPILLSQAYLKEAESLPLKCLSVRGLLQLEDNLSEIQSSF